MIRALNRHLAPAASEAFLVPPWRRILYGKIQHFALRIRVTYETSFTMRGATNVTGQVHQILRLPRKMNLMIDPRHIWNVIYNAEQAQSASNLTKYCACQEICKFKISAEPPWIASANRKTIRRPSEDHPTTIRSQIVISHPPPRRPSPSHLGDAFCMEKCNISCSGYLSKFHQVLRVPRKVTLQLQQILRLPRKMHPTLL